MTMEQKAPVIKYGAIIHLHNGLPNGGYLDTRGLMNDKQIVKNVYDPRINTFVFTHANSNRLLGSGSWEILSADNKQIGEPVMIGDRIHLRSMSMDGAYLDSSEWLKNPGEFEKYPEMKNGVFTSRKPKLHRWTIQIDGATNRELREGDAIRLCNDPPGTNYLRAHGKVADHTLFKNYHGQQHLVFIAPPSTPKDGSDTWTITLNSRVEHTYYLFKKNEALIHHGILKHNGLWKQPITSLKVDSKNQDTTLEGQLVNADDEPVDVRLKRDEQTKRYIFTLSTDKPANTETSSQPLDGTWVLSSRSNQPITAIDIESTDDGRTLNGTITYSGETATPMKAIRATWTLFGGKEGAFLYDFFGSDLWKTRIQAIRDALDILIGEFGSILQTLGIKNAIDLDKDKKHAYLSNSFVLSSPSQKTSYLDFDYQATQLLNIHTLSLDMKTFWNTIDKIANETLSSFTKDHMLPPVDQIRALIQQFTIDFEIIQRAIQQRRWLGEFQGVAESNAQTKTAESNAQAKTLVVTDKLTLMAIAPIQHLFSDSKDIVPITYFNQSISIRKFPYNNRFILVGLTYDLVLPIQDAAAQGASPAFELMAIPHEVGHFAFHQASKDEQPLFANIGKEFEKNQFRRWCEELFADLYGCMVAGPFAALGMQALLATGNKERILMDDEDHPTPVLRPFLLSEMLQTLSKKKPDHYDFEDVAKLLDANWTAILERRGFVTENIVDGRPARIILPTEPESNKKNLLDVNQTVKNARPIIERFADILLKNAELEPAKTQTDAGNTQTDATKLSTKIPWSVKRDSLQELVQDITELTWKRIADKRVVQQYVRPISYEMKKQDENDTFAVILEGWGDKGPLASGGGTHG